jgi:hypothetical protein
MMPFIWYPSHHAAKSNGISTKLERLRRIKVPEPRPEFASKVHCGQMRRLIHALVEGLKSWLQVIASGLRAVEQTKRAGNGSTRRLRQRMKLAGELSASWDVLAKSMTARH